MYEYNFNDIRKTIEEILDKSLTKSKEKNYNERSIEWTSKYREGSNRF